VLISSDDLIRRCERPTLTAYLFTVTIPAQTEEVITVIWILVILILAAAALALTAFVILVVGVHSTDRRTSPRDVSDNSIARSFARRVLGGVYVRQESPSPDRDQVRR
jgi:hypothetical protein